MVNQVKYGKIKARKKSVIGSFLRTNLVLSMFTHIFRNVSRNENVFKRQRMNKTTLPVGQEIRRSGNSKVILKTSIFIC